MEIQTLLGYNIFKHIFQFYTKSIIDFLLSSSLCNQITVPFICIPK